MDISIIIPYYNTGQYLPDALNSINPIIQHPQYQCEVIIINDGSTDPASIKLLDELKNEKYVMIHQENKGAGAARNAGLRMAKGENILFLDSDNKLREAFITQGLPLLKKNEADIVYGRANFFGASKKTLFKQDVFHMPTLLAENYIDVCCLFKRKVYEAIGGFDESPILNQEDWEYWIRAGEAGFKFHFINEVFYDYRIHENSTTNSINDETYYRARKYIYDKHPGLVIDSFFYLSDQFNAYREDKKRPFRSFLKYIYLKYFKQKSKNLPG